MWVDLKSLHNHMMMEIHRIGYRYKWGDPVNWQEYADLWLIPYLLKQNCKEFDGAEEYFIFLRPQHGAEAESGDV